MSVRALQERESQFFAIAKQSDYLPRYTPKIFRFEQEILPSKLYAGIDHESVRAQVLETDLGIPGTNVTVLSTPEAEAISGTGLFMTDPQSGNLQFVLPRFHLGWEAQLNMKTAVSQLIRTRKLAEHIEDSDPSNSGIIQFTREGHLPDLQMAIGMGYGTNIPTTVVKISHIPADNSFTRKASVEPNPNLEGIPKRLKRLFIVDPVASGLQHIAMLEKLDDMDRLADDIVAIAPMATKYGIEIIAEYCKQKRLNFSAGVCANLLDINPPLYYYSPYPVDPNQTANTRLHKFIENAFGVILHRFCIRGNWTGSFMAGPDFPLTASEEELQEYGLSNQRLFDLSRKVTSTRAEAEGVLKDLLPLSTKLKLGNVIFDSIVKNGSQE